MNGGDRVVCPKCGDVQSRWSVTYVPPGQHVSVNGPDGAAQGECLIKCCYECGFEFKDTVKNAGTYSPPIR